MKSTALLIDDDVNGLEIFGHVLRQQGFEVLVAENGRTGVSMAARGTADVILLDLRLPDVSGIDALRMIRQTDRTLPVIMMTAYATTQSVVQAMRLGAADYIEKPLTEADLLQAVHAALNHTDRAGVPASHAAARWADAMVRVVEAREDPRTLRLWGRHIGVSPGSLRNWCRMAGLSPKRSLSMARMIRAVVWAPSADRPENLFDVTDRRTLAHLMRLGDTGAPSPPRLPRTLTELFSRQQWIANPVALEELKRALATRRVFGPNGSDDEND